MTTIRKKLKPPKGEPHSEYHKIWRQVDGVVRQTFKAHPEYLTDSGRRNARLSLVKRITGQLSSPPSLTGETRKSDPT
jgi:hypothetical protein